MMSRSTIRLGGPCDAPCPSFAVRAAPHIPRGLPRGIPVAGVAGGTPPHYLQRRPHAVRSRRGPDAWAPVPVGCAVCALREGHEGRQTSSAVLAPGERRSMADIVLINPRFEVSYWGLEHALPLLGKRANMPVACLPLLAALTPPGHSVTLIDENVEPIDFDRCAGPTSSASPAWSSSARRMREILDRAEAARGVRRGRRAVGHGPGGRLRRPGRRHLRRRGRADLAPVPPGLGAGAAPGRATSRPRRPT